MNTGITETDFYQKLADLARQHHPNLVVTIPASGSVAPDCIVENPATGSAFVVETKLGPQAQQIPLSTIPRLTSFKAQFPDGHLVLVSSGTIPALVREQLSSEGIECRQVGNIQEAEEWLRRKLAELDETQQR